MTRGEILEITPHLIAKADDVNANSLGLTVLSFENGGSMDKHIPLDVVIERKTGNFTSANVLIKINGTTITNISLNGLNASNRYLGSLRGNLVPNSGNITVDVNVINGSSATFDIMVYGISL